MKRNKSVLFALLVGSMLLSACGSTSVEKVATDTSFADVQEAASSTVTGMIQKIENNTITLATMEMASGEAPSGDRPEQPSGEAPSGDKPEQPSGEAPADSSRPEMPESNGTTATITLTDTTTYFDASGNTITLSDLQESSMITVQIDDNNCALSVTLSNTESEMGAPGNNQSAPTSYAANTHYTENAQLSNETITSTGTDENAVLVSDGASVSLDQMTITRTSSDSAGGDASSFYGIGAAVLTTDGTVNITNSTIETNASGGAGVFAYADGITYVSDSTITTQQDTSGGIHVAGGGTLYATNLTIETNGESAAAIRSDRGGGTMSVDGGTYTSKGSGSPAVYCTADITVANANLVAEGSEAICIEGLNSLTLTDCNLTGNMSDLSQNDCTWTVILYQSMSGDSEVGNSTFTMNGGTLTSENGGLFYTTNTESTFYLSNVEITCADDCEFFLKCTGNQNQRGWGNSGDNGADCTFTAENQTMNGDILWDSISTLEFIMKQNSCLTGAIRQDESAVQESGSGYANLTIDETSTWIVTDNSALSALTNYGTIVDVDNKAVTIQGVDGTVYVEGTSPYTVTVSTYNK